jgi:formamidopyrimidine-DNA glycosylase
MAVDMPEMPEIETLARKLRDALIGKQIAQVRLSGLPLRKPIACTFAAKIRGRTIRKISRRGKYLILELEPRAFWLMHLGMSGRVLYHAPTGETANHTHAIIKFSDSTELEYRDHRRFGLLAAYEVSHIKNIPEISALGIDPLSPRFNRDWLFPLLRKSRQEIKSFLLDQRQIAGLGNIYACEALFLAQINPARRCCTLTMGETGRLVHSIRKVLRLAIRHRGTSFSDFMDSDGNPGENQNNLKVFQREGKDCVRCGAPIHRIKQGNRSSFVCYRCQGKES